jgi:hypothetical protein
MTHAAHDQPTLAMLQLEALKVKNLYDELNQKQRARTGPTRNSCWVLWGMLVT